MKYCLSILSMKIYLFLSLFIIISCSSEKTEWKTIDAESFTISVPNNFNYEKKQGIDSQVGEITGDSLKFLFDFGFYTDQNPKTNEEFAEKMILLTNTGLYEELLEKLGLPDTFKHIDILRYFKIEKVDTTTFIATIKYQKKLVDIKLNMFWYDEEDDSRNYLFQIDTIGEWRRKIFYPKNNFAERSGIVLRKPSKKIGNFVALGLSIYNGKPNDSVMIMKILKSIRIKDEN
jgi:uncharacterized protein YcfL